MDIKELISSGKVKIENRDGIVLSKKDGCTDEDMLEIINNFNNGGERVYVEVDGSLIRDYNYKLQCIFNKYGRIEVEQGGLTDKDKDNFLQEVISVSNKLKPIDRDIFIKEFLSIEAIKELGITEKSITETIEEIQANEYKYKKIETYNELLKKVNRLQEEEEIDIDDKIEFIEGGIKEIKIQDKATSFNDLFKVPTIESIFEEESLLPDSINSGIRIFNTDIMLEGGGITGIAAPTNHGKTIMLINMLLNVVERHPEKNFIFFTYEEKSNAILQYILNAYINEPLNNGALTNRSVIRRYFKSKGEDVDFIKLGLIDKFKQKVEEFFSKYIQSGRMAVKYVDYNSYELCTAIEYLNREMENLGGVFIDYFQLLKLPQGKYKSYSSRQEELKQICIDLKDTAVNTGLPLILAAQFNREVTNLERLHPTNISEAGDIERIMHTLVGLWNMNKKPVQKTLTKPEEDRIREKLQSRGITNEDNTIYVELLKSRTEPTGVYDFLEFDGNTGKIKNRDTNSFS